MANIKSVNPYGKYDVGLRKFFPTEKTRKEYVKVHNLIENPSMESEKHKVIESIEEINYEREKNGQRPLSSQQIVGNSQASRYIRTGYFSFPNNPLAKK